MMEIDMLELLPESFSFEVYDEMIHAWRITKGSGSCPVPVDIPRCVPLDKNFMEGFSLYLGDGSLKNDYHLCFASKDNDLVQKIQKWFQKYFWITPSEMQYYLRHGNDSPSDIEEWSNMLSLESDDISSKPSTRHRHSTMNLQVSSVLLCDIFRNLFPKVIALIPKLDLDTKRAFLKGIFAAEGSIAVNRQENYVVCLTICMNYHEEQDIIMLIHKLLAEQGIVSRMYCALIKASVG